VRVNDNGRCEHLPYKAYLASREFHAKYSTRAAEYRDERNGRFLIAFAEENVMPQRWIGSLVVLVMLLVCADAGAIIRRHDREDNHYLELAAKYPAVTRLGGGTATLVDPRWLLTAGHVAANLSPFDKAVRFNGRAYAIESVVIHPKSGVRNRLKRVDHALIKLAEPVQGVAPVSIYDKDDEKGQTVVFVGPGMYGDGLSGPQGDDGKMRAATNTVADVLENYITFKFDAPPDGTELEGISGPGDSGGPALIEADGMTFIIGVSSANDDAGAAGPCRYHSTEYYARVSTALEWIRTTMESNVPPQAPLGEAFDLQSGKWPDSRAGRIAAALFEAYARDTDEAMETFERTYRAESALKDRPVEERVSSWRKLRAEWGALKAHKYIADGTDILHVLLRAEGEGVWKTFRFALEPDEPHKLTGIGVDSPVVGE